MANPKENIADDIAYASMASLLQCRLLARDLKLSRQRKILSQQAGLHLSRFRGRGVDFSEVRSYQAGDDIRNIDWRVTARTGKAHTKLYAEERERPSLVILDQSDTLFFGSRVCFKSVTACRVAALLAWAALQRGDRSGGTVFSNQQLRNIKPRRSRHAVLAFIEQALLFNHALNRRQQIPERSQGLHDALQHARRITKPGSELFIVSDFLHVDCAIQQQLYQLAQHNDVVCVVIRDPLEVQLPKTGRYQISDGRQRQQVDLNDRKLQERYQKDYRQQLNDLQKLLDELKIPIISVNTDSDILSALRQGLGITGRKRQP